MGGVLNAFQVPARQGFLVELVGREEVSNAVGLHTSLFNVARMIGPAAAGLVVAELGEGWCFVANGVSFTAIIAALLIVKSTPGQAAKPGRGSFALVVEGFTLSWRTAPVRALLLFLGAVSLLGVPYITLMPAFAERLHGGPRALGILLAAGGGGALLAATILARRSGVDGLQQRIALAGAAFGVGLALFAASRWFWVSVSLLVPCAVAYTFLAGATNALLLSMVPARVHGRVMAIFSMMIWGLPPVGAVIAGALAKYVGMPLTVVVGGIACVACAVAFRSYFASLRDEAGRLIRTNRDEAAALRAGR
jgi:MFS family permease